MGYRGELMIVQRHIEEPRTALACYNVGERCAQILIRRRERIVFDEVKTLNELGETDRGQGGFGSTNE